MDSGYPIAAEALDLEIYVLACLFIASPELVQLGAETPGLRWVRRTFEASEAARRLIGLAVMLRNKLDTSGGGPDASVGRLLTDVSRPKETAQLSLREACNKIIHAESVEFAPNALDNDGPHPISRTIKLYGTQKGKQWEAELNILTFLDAACVQF